MLKFLLKFILICMFIKSYCLTNEVLIYPFVLEGGVVVLLQQLVTFQHTSPNNT